MGIGNPSREGGARSSQGLASRSFVAELEGRHFIHSCGPQSPVSPESSIVMPVSITPCTYVRASACLRRVSVRTGAISCLACREQPRRYYASV